MAQVIEHKRGDTFQLVGWLGSSDNKSSLAGMSIKSQMRDATNAIFYSFQPSIDSAANIFLLEASSLVTAAWPLGAYTCDVQMTDSAGVVRSSPTFTIKIVADVTE